MISQFLKILNRVLIKKIEGKPITQEEFKVLLLNLYQIAIGSKDVNDWANRANNLLEKFEKEGKMV